MEIQFEKAVIVVAGGSGKRMGAEIPKQFLTVAGKPLLMHTIQRFYDYDPLVFVVVVLPFGHIETWNRLCSEYRFLIAHQIVAGGEERFFSVRNGLTLIPENCLVAVHDGVRPLVSNKVINHSFDLASRYGGAVPVIFAAESIRKINREGSMPVNRDEYRLVQTPQTFKADLLKKAYDKPYNPRFTDDATVFESAGYKVHLFEGNEENIKITRPFDLDLVGFYLNTKL